MFDYCNNARHHQTCVCTQELFHDVLRFTTVGDICSDIKDAHEKVLRGEMSREDFETFKRQEKIKLPVFLFQAHFKDNIRHNASAEPSGLSILDIDHITQNPGDTGDTDDTVGAQAKPGSPAKPLANTLKQHLLKEEAIGDPETIEKLKSLGIVLVHITPSCEGLRLVFKLQQGESLIEGQKRMAQELGLKEFDEACKDLARCSFAVPEDYILYEDEEGLWADPTPCPSPSGRGDTHQDNTPALFTQSKTHQDDVSTKSKTHQDDASSHPQGVAQSPLPEREGLGGGSSLSIFDAVVAASGLSLENLNNIGTRHNSLITILSMGICRLMKEDELKAVIAERMPDYSKEKDCQELIRDFYQKYTDPSRPMSMKLRKIYIASLNNASLKNKEKGIKNTESGENSEAEEDIDPENASGKMDEKNLRILRICETLPIGLKDSLEGIPLGMKMPVLCAVLPLAAAYADQVTVRYCDGAEQRLGLMSIIVGPQASGKSSCAKKVALWERQMKDEDARAREIEDKWKEERKSRKANEKAPDDPCVLIRSVPATISCSTLLKRFKNSRGHTLWTFCSELDTLRKTNGAGSWSSKYDIYRLGFDYDEWGQDYNSDQAVSGVVHVAYNFSILGTYGALRKCFKGDNIENGLSSRIILAEMPDSAFAPMPCYGQSSADSAQAIDQAVTILKSKSGFVDTPGLRNAIGKWVEEKRLEAMADADLVKDTYRKRAAVCGFRCGVVAMLLEGKESDNVVNFSTMMAQYILDEQMAIFGDALQIEFKKAAEEARRQTKNNSIFDELPPTFTLDDLKQAKGADVARRSLQMIISRWKSSCWIKKTGFNKWEKLRNK